MFETSQVLDSLRSHVHEFRHSTSIFWEESFRDRLNKTVVLTALSIGGFIYLIYKVTRIPDVPIPQLDLKKWWGPEEKKGSQDTGIKNFRIEFTEEMIKDLRQRLSLRRKFTPPLEGVGFRYGFNSDYLEDVLDFWSDSYNFQEREAFLNKFPHFKTDIQGLDMHFIHVKPAVDKGVRVVPLLLLHGWPGSVREFYEIIPMLTTQRKGYDFVFEVIVPSLPGYGFSSGAVRPGLGAIEVAVVMRNLMHRIGHKKFFVQGGDWGAGIGSHMTTLFPSDILGFHSNMMLVNSGRNNLRLLLGSLRPSCVVEEKYKDRMYPVLEKYANLLEESGYMHIQSTKPDTVGFGLSDSPAGLAAYILEKFSTWTDNEFRDLDDGGLTKKYRLEHLLDNIMIYWSTNSITTSMRLYAESMSKRQRSLQLDSITTPVPCWALKTKYEIIYQPDKFLKTKFINLLGSTTIDDGGHFAAFEMPALLADEVFKAVEKFQKFNLKRVW